MTKTFGFASMGAVMFLAAIGIASMRPSWAVTAFSIVKCGATTACTGGKNTSSGPGVQGISSLGKGVLGQTKFASTSSSNGQSGVLGEDLSRSGKFDSGVAGTSVRGIGVSGVSSSNSAIRGTSTSGIGVSGTTSTGVEAILGSVTSTTGNGTGVRGEASGFGPGVWGSSVQDVGVFGNGNEGVEGEDFAGVAGANNRDAVFASGYGGRLFRGNNSHGQDVFVVNDTGFVTMAGSTSGSASSFSGLVGFGTGVGVRGTVEGGTVANPAGVEGDNDSDAGSKAVYANGFGGNLFVGNSANGSDVFVVDDGGNVHAHSFTADLPAATTTRSGSTISTYSHESRLPTIEDFGEARLEAGQAYVRLNPDFASVTTRGYYVFVTPLGPTQGLYVSHRTAAGFYVRENLSGRSNVAFDYRIVGERPVQEIPRPVVRMHVPKIRLAAPSFPTHPKQRPISNP